MHRNKCPVYYWSLSRLCKINTQGPVHTRPEEFENGGFTLKTHQMFSVHRKNLKTQQSSEPRRFRKVSFSKCFLST